MKKFVLELFQGKEHIFSGSIDQPITLRILDETEVKLEITLKSPQPKRKEDGEFFGRQAGDDFTMPMPLTEEVEVNKTHGTFPYDLQEGRFIYDQKEEDRGLPEGLSDNSSLLLFDESLTPDDQSLNLSFDSLDMYTTPENLENTVPDLPELPTMDSVDIAVLQEKHGLWTCIHRLSANDEYVFFGIRVWVDERAALVLRGSEDVIILVRHEDGFEEEFDGINGSLSLTPRATVLIQRDNEQICFRPEA